MANLLFLSDFSATVLDDDPGGSNPTGTLTWQDPLFFVSNNLYKSPAPYLDNGMRLFALDKISQKLVWLRIVNTTAPAPKDRVLYSITDLADNQLALNFASNALGGFTINAGSQYVRLWTRNGKTRLLITGAGNSNSLQHASVDLATGQFHSGFTTNLINTSLGINSTYSEMWPSPNGDDLYMMTNNGGDTYRIARIVLQSGSDHFTNLEWVTSSFHVNNIPLGVSNNHIYTRSGSLSEFSSIRKLNKTTGALEAEISPPISGQWYNSNRVPAIVTSTSIYFLNDVRASNGNFPIRMGLFKYSLATDQLIGYWELKNPPQQPGFIPGNYDEFDPPEALAFLSDGTLLLRYANDQSAWQNTSQGQQSTLRVQRVKLS